MPVWGEKVHAMHADGCEDSAISSQLSALSFRFSARPCSVGGSGDGHPASVCYEILRKTEADPSTHHPRPPPRRRRPVCGGPGTEKRSGPLSLLMNGVLEGCGFPLIRQKHANEWGTVHLRFIQGVTRCASQDAQDDGQFCVAHLDSGHYRGLVDVCLVTISDPGIQDGVA